MKGKRSMSCRRREREAAGLPTPAGFGRHPPPVRLARHRTGQGSAHLDRNRIGAGGIGARRRQRQEASNRLIHLSALVGTC